MPKNISFIEKLMHRFDRIDKSALQDYVLDLVEDGELYRSILQQLTEGVLLMNSDGQIRFMNGQALNWFGLEVPPANQKQLLDKIADPALTRCLRDVLKNSAERAVKDIHVVSPYEVFLRFYFVPLEVAKKCFRLIILVNRTEEKSKKVDAERLARIEGLIRLAAGVAHEIGNPLNSLSIHLQLLKKELQEIPKPRRQMMENSLSVIHTETERLDRIVKNFLKAARKPPLRFRAENLNMILETAIDFMRPELEKNKVKVEFKMDSKIPDFLVDRDRLYQAFINLIKNAMESMSKGGRLKIDVTHQAKIALIRFQDDGQGIAEEDLPHIFDAYYTTKEEGSGLGLMMVYDTCSEHDGWIEVTSKRGRGTTFNLFLPIRQPKLQLPNYGKNSEKA